jgi:lipoprotein-anchoring transpeptidase ErfK/SrfK
MGGRAWSEPALSQSTRRVANVRPASVARAPDGLRLMGLTAAVERRQRLAARVRQSREPQPALLVAATRALPITARPGGGRVVGTMPAGSPFYGIPTVAWIHRRAAGSRYGLVDVPYSGTRATGWIRISGLKVRRTPFAVRADLSRREVVVTRLGVVIMRFRAAIGAPASPTPTGRYFVTDRVPFSPSSSLGAFAFGISGIQTNLPPGWRGGNQLAIHGTNDPGSIGQAASAGCLRVSRRALERLKPALSLGTPVTIRP